MKAFGILLIIGGLIGALVFGSFLIGKEGRDTKELDALCGEYTNKNTGETILNFRSDCFVEYGKTQDQQNSQALIAVVISIVAIVSGFSLVSAGSNSTHKKKE
jgi:hypothetical protein